MLAGGSESNVDPLTIAGFARMKALSSESDPLLASRPFDAKRNGFVIAEGSCILVLEELSHALNRGATIIAEVSGYGVSGDAHHSTSPSPNGEGAVRSMLSALRDAELTPGDIGYINAHATSTPAGDRIELAAIETVFGGSLARNPLPVDTSSAPSSSPSSSSSSSSSTRQHPLYISSTKGATGHLLGAAGALESAFACLAVRDGILPATLGLTEPEPSSFQLVANHALHYATGAAVTSYPLEPSSAAREAASDRVTLKHALKNSFGFGGTNASLIFSKFTL